MEEFTSKYEGMNFADASNDPTPPPSHGSALLRCLRTILGLKPRDVLPPAPVPEPSFSSAPSPVICMPSKWTLVHQEDDDQVLGAHLSPKGYLDAIVTKLTTTFVQQLAVYDATTGLRTELNGGLPTSTIVDEKLYRTHLAYSGLAAAAIDRRIEFERGVPTEQITQAMRMVEQGISAKKKFCLRLLGNKDRKRIKAVPFGCAHTPFHIAGAYPVPAGGDVIVVSSMMAQLHVWISWMMLLLGGGLPKTAEIQNLQMSLFSALPGLAGNIMGITASRAFMPSVAAAMENIHLIDSDALERRCWLAQVFVLMHEIGHIILGHTDQLRRWLTQPVPTGDDLRERRALERQYEFVADRFAVEQMDRGVRMETGTWEDIPTAVLNVFRLFRFAEPYTHQTDMLDTHPTAIERFREIAPILFGDKTEGIEMADILVECFRAGVEEKRPKRPFA